jgi:uncharacterized membrane protein
MHAELLILRIIHVIGGIFWVGSATFVAFFLFPTVQEMGPAGGQVMAGLGKRKFMAFMPISAILTVLAGIRLMMKASAGSGSAWFKTPVGMTYGISATLVILIFVHGMTVVRPATDRLGKIPGEMNAPGANKEALGAEMKALQAKVGFNVKLTAIVLIVAAAGMALGRYM